MNRGSLVQDILDEVSSRTMSFQIKLHLLITLVKSSEYFRFIESLRICIMASHYRESPFIIPVILVPPTISLDIVNFHQTDSRRVRLYRQERVSQAAACDGNRHQVAAKDDNNLPFLPGVLSL